MTDAQKVDILIPHYNDPFGLALSIRSVLSQDWQGEKRIVVADDGSTRANLEAAKLILDGLPVETVLLESRENRGRPFVRNILLDAIESPFTAWLDAGDEWYPRKLSQQFSAIAQLGENERASPYWITCSYDWHRLGRRKYLVKQSVQQDQLRGLLVGRDLRAYLWTLLAPSQAFKDVGWFDLNLPRLQDLDFFIRFVLKGGIIRGSGVRRALCVYHKSDIGRDAQQIRSCNRYIFEKYKFAYEQYGNNFQRGRLFEMELLSARFALHNKKKVLSVIYLMRALATKPESFVKRILTKGVRF